MIEWLEAHQLPCFFREIWGIQCPGCGFQTALLLLLKGNIQAAVVSWPGIVPLFAFGLFLIGRCCGIRKISAGFLKGTGFCCVATILLVYVFRFIRMGQVIVPVTLSACRRILSSNLFLRNRYEKNVGRVVKKCRFCLFDNNFNFIFALMNQAINRRRNEEGR
mgnify:CR=1 FL=1